MDQLDFMIVVKDILENCKDEKEIRKRMLKMKTLITQIGEHEIEYRKVMEE